MIGCLVLKTFICTEKAEIRNEVSALTLYSVKQSAFDPVCKFYRQPLRLYTLHCLSSV